MFSNVRGLHMSSSFGLVLPSTIELEDKSVGSQGQNVAMIFVDPCM